jgi:hypothetical protein
MSQETDKKKYLDRFTKDEDFRFHWNFDLPVSESEQKQFANWYDVAAQKLITIPKEKLAGGLDYVGYMSAGDTIYCGNSNKLIALQSTTNQQLSVTETLFQNPNRDRNILSLQIKTNGSDQSKVLPVLAGVDTLLLNGNPDGLTVGQESWNHHRLIVFHRVSNGEAERRDRIHLQFANAQNLRMTRLKNDLVLDLPSQPHSTRLLFKDFFAAGKTWNLSFSLPDRSERVLRFPEDSLQMNASKSLVEASAIPATV